MADSQTFSSPTVCVTGAGALLQLLAPQGFSDLVLYDASSLPVGGQTSLFVGRVYAGKPASMGGLGFSRGLALAQVTSGPIEITWSTG